MGQASKDGWLLQLSRTAERGAFLREPRTVLFGKATVVSKKLEYGPGTIYAGVPSSLCFAVGGQSYSSFLGSSVVLNEKLPRSQLSVFISCISLRGLWRPQAPRLPRGLVVSPSIAFWFH